MRSLIVTASLVTAALIAHTLSAGPVRAQEPGFNMNSNLSPHAVPYRPPGYYDPTTPQPQPRGYYREAPPQYYREAPPQYYNAPPPGAYYGGGRSYGGGAVQAQDSFGNPEVWFRPAFGPNGPYCVQRGFTVQDGWCKRYRGY